MKKHLVILAVCFLGLFFSTKIYTQNINATLTINPYPSPYVTDWQNNPAALGSITIFNNSGRSFKIVIKTSIATQGRGEVLTCTTQPIQLTEQPVQIINNTQFINFSDVSFKNSDYKQKAQQSGRLLEGVYIVCFTIEDLNGVVLVPKLCSNFTILYPPPPHLIYPANLDTLDLNTNYPTFQWTPVVVPSAYQIKYTIRIVEVLQGQIPSQAISSNVPIYENNQLVTNSLTYPIGAFPLEAGKKYAWQVQCLDQYGLPPTQNQGRSEIFTFVKKKLLSPHFTEILLLLESPENNEAIKTKTPIFRWKITPQPSVNVKYNIRVVKVLPNQNLETAIHNYPIINTTTTATSYEPSQPLPLNASDTYAWQVYALNSATNDTIAKSEIRKFTLFKLILLLPNNNAVVNNKKPTFQWAFYGNKKYYDLVVKEIRVNINSPDGSVSDDKFKEPYNLIIYQKQDIDGAAISSVNQQGLEVPVFTPEYDIPMEEGKSYYWQVWVKDQPSGYIQGRSEIRKFDYNPFQPGFATNCSVSGTLYYQFATHGDNEKWQLKNINIKFVVKYILKYTSYKGTSSYNGQTSSQGEIEIPITSLSPNYQSDYNKTIAVTKTDAQGNFFFSFWNSKPMGVIDNNFTFTNGGAPEQFYSYSGKLYRVIKLIVESPYYTSPRTDIIVQPGENKMYNSMVAQVRSYSLNVTVRSPNEYWHNPQFLSSNSPISNMFVYILRKNKPGEVPSNEGLSSPTDSTESPFPGSYQSGYKVIAKGITDSKGQVTFERLVKSVYSQNDEYFIYVIADSTSTTLLYQSLIPISFKFKNQGDNAVYNYEYQYPVTSTDVVAFPKNPIIKGKVKRQDGGQPIWKAQVKLLVRDVMGYVEEAKQFTNHNGEFRFENLADNVVNLQGNVLVPIRHLQITNYGFRDTILLVNDGVPLKPGVFWSREILLQPESKIIGKIVNEYGEGISAWVTVDGGESQEVIAPVIPSSGFAPKRAPAPFSLQAPTGWVRVIFDLIDKLYMRDTVDIIITGSVYDMGTIVLKRAMHRIKVFVGSETNIPLHPEITGARVKLETFDGNVLIGEKRTDSQGYAEFMFFNNAKDYKITVSAPPGRDFQTSQMNIHNTESKDWKFYNIYLKPATNISGYVYVGNNKQPVPNAKITIKGISNETFPVAYTDSNGYYVLHNVPIGLNKFVASKKSSNLIGDETGILIVPKEGLQNINFNLKIYS